MNNKIFEHIKNNKFLFFTSMLVILFMFANSHSHIFLMVLMVSSIIISVLMDKMATITEFISVSKLANRLKEADLKVIESEKKFKDFFIETKIPMCMFNLNTKRFVESNEILCNLLEYTEEELKEMDLDQLVAPEKLDESLKIINVSKTGGGIDEHHNIYLSKSGKRVHIKWIFAGGNVDHLKYAIALP